MTKLLAILAVFTTACIADAETPDEGDVSISTELAREIAPADEPADDSFCDLLPDDETDPCSFACDPDELARFIPDGTCALFACRLSDDRVIKTGGCRL